MSAASPDPLGPDPDHAGGVTRSRALLLNSSLVLAPLLLMVGTALTPSGLSDRINGRRTSALAQLADIAGARDRLPLAVVLIVLGLAALVPAAFELAFRVPSSRLAVVGAVLVAVGAPMGAATNASSAFLVYQLTDPAVPRDSAVDVRVASSGQAPVFFLFLLAVLGVVLLAVALWRGRAARWWEALLLGGGVLCGFAAPEGAGAVFTLPMLAGMGILAWRGHRQGPSTRGRLRPEAAVR
jgi:hypothetical protein